MPQILVSGHEDKRAIPFWAEQPLKCSACKCQFQMLPDEDALVFLERAEAGGTPHYAHVYCPHCGARVTAENREFVPPVKTDAEKLADERAAHAATLEAFNTLGIESQRLNAQITSLQSVLDEATMASEEQPVG